MFHKNAPAKRIPLITCPDPPSLDCSSLYCIQYNHQWPIEYNTRARIRILHWRQKLSRIFYTLLRITDRELLRFNEGGENYKFTITLFYCPPFEREGRTSSQSIAIPGITNFPRGGHSHNIFGHSFIRSNDSALDCNVCGSVVCRTRLSVALEDDQENHPSVFVNV